MTHYFTRLETAIRLNWQRKALADHQGESFTYGQMAVEIERLHLIFESIGIEKEDKIALCSRNSARWAVLFLAANTYGAVVVPILSDFNPKSIGFLVNHSESKLLFTDSAIWDRLDVARLPFLKAAFLADGVKLVYATDPNTESAIARVPSLFWERFPAGFSTKNVRFMTGNETDIALINYTSGTTSVPKGVMIRYESLSSNIDFATCNLGGGPGDRIVSMLPLAHMYGMAFEFLYPICNGMEVTFLGKAPTPATLLSAMSSIRPFLVITVPMVMEKIFRNRIQPALSTPSMKILTRIPLVRQLIFKKIRQSVLASFGGNVSTIIMGGAALNPEVEIWLRRFGLPFTVGYGMTEGAPLFAYEAWDRFVLQSCGKAVDNVEIRIDSGNPLAEVGEIQVRGLNVMSGYFKNPDATDSAFTADGWLRTGDLGLMDEEGNIFIKGRSKNMILTSNGQNIYPEEIEAVLNNVPYVQESVVVARGKSIVALVYPDSERLKKDGYGEGGFQSAFMQVMTEVNRELPSYGHLSGIELVHQPFEKTPKMSIKRFLYM